MLRILYMQNGHNACNAQIITFLFQNVKAGVHYDCFSFNLSLSLSFKQRPALFVGFGMAPLPSNAYKEPLIKNLTLNR